MNIFEKQCEIAKTFPDKERSMFDSIVQRIKATKGNGGFWLENGMICGTNGHIALGFPAPDGIHDADWPRLGAASMKKIEESVDGLSVTLNAFDFELSPEQREMFKPKVHSEPIFGKCGKCDGSGEIVCNLGHEHDCTKCDGTGESREVVGHRNSERFDHENVRFLRHKFAYKYLRIALEIAIQFNDGKFECRSSETVSEFIIGDVVCYIAPIREPIFRNDIVLGQTTAEVVQ